MGSPFRLFFNPLWRYRHAKLIHAVRVALAISLAIFLTSLVDLPRREWTSITVLIVMGGLQHQGNIRRKAMERGIGTLIGAAAGLFLILQQSYFGSSLATGLMMAAAAGLCAYHAIGKGGYIALLSAITIFIIAGHGDSSLADGLWRTVDIILGIVIALAFSFALPLYATWSWRYRLADALRGCAAAQTRLMTNFPLGDAEDIKATAGLSGQLVQLRGLIPWVAKETGIPAGLLDEIQQSLRLCISALDLIAGIRRHIGENDAQPLIPASLAEQGLHARRMLLGMARALKLGRVYRLEPSPPCPPAPSDGTTLLTVQLFGEIDRIRQLLAKTADQWNL